MNRRRNYHRARMCLASRRSKRMTLCRASDFYGIVKRYNEVFFGIGNLCYPDHPEHEFLRIYSNSFWIQSDWSPLRHGRLSVYGDVIKNPIDHLEQPWIVTFYDGGERWLTQHDSEYRAPSPLGRLRSDR